MMTSPSSSLPTNQQGFTLIELLLAMAIFALVSLAGFSMFDTVRKSDELSRNKLDQINQLQTLFLLMERDFSQIARRHVRLDGNESNENYLHSEDLGFSSQSEAIAFVRHGWTNPSLVIARSSLQSVAYRIEDNQLQRLYFNHVDAQVGEDPKVRVLLEGVEELAFRYFYNNSWQDNRPVNALPKAIAVEVITQDLGTFSRKFLVAGDEVVTGKSGDSDND